MHSRIRRPDAFHAVCTSGGEWILGMPIDSVDGETLAAKQDSLAKMKPEQLIAKCSESGFYTYVEPKTGILIPGKFCYIVVNAQSRFSHGVKWCAIRVKPRIQEGINFLQQYETECPGNATVARVVRFLEEEALNAEE